MVKGIRKLIMSSSEVRNVFGYIGKGKLKSVATIYFYIIRIRLDFSAHIDVTFDFL